MKKSFLLFTVLLISLILNCEIIQVPGDFATIQSAIDESVDGDIIQVSMGNYAEQLLIEKSISIIGVGSEYTSIELPADRDNVLSLDNDIDYLVAASSDSLLNFRLSGFTLNMNEQVNLNGAESLYGVILHNVESDGMPALSSCVLTGFSDDSAVSGIMLAGSSNCEITGNEIIEAPHYGIACGFNTNGLVANIHDNTITGSLNCDVGILLMNCEGSSFANNIIDGYNGTGEDFFTAGMWIYSTDNLEIGPGNEVSDCYRGIYFSNSDGCDVFENSVSECYRNYITLVNSNDNHVFGNTITGFSPTGYANRGISFEGDVGCDNNLIGGDSEEEGNDIWFSTYGYGTLYCILVQSESVTGERINYIRNNRINGGKRAIQIDDINDGTLVVENNIFNDMEESSYCTICSFDQGFGMDYQINNNTFYGTVRPIEFWGAHEVDITGNTFTGEINYDVINFGRVTGGSVISGNSFDVSSVANCVNIQTAYLGVEIAENSFINYEGGAMILHNDANVHDNEVTTCNRGIEIVGTAEVVIAGNEIADCSIYGINLGSDLSNAEITNNTITGTSTGHYAISCNNVNNLIVSGNTISENGSGLLLNSYETSLWVQDNSFIDNEFVGISVFTEVENITGNTLLNNARGIEAYAAFTATNNELLYHQYGSVIVHSEGPNVVEYNWWGDETGPQGMGFGGSGSNVITNGNIVDCVPWWRDVEMTASYNPQEANILLPDNFLLEMNVNTTIDFDAYINRDEFELSSDGSVNIGISINGSEVTFMPGANWTGSEVLNFTLTVGDTIRTDDVEVVVEEVALVLPEILASDEDVAINQDFSSYIVGNGLSLMCEVSENFSVDISGYNVVISPLLNWFGNEILTFYLEDTGGVSVVEDNVIVIINPVNDAPEIISISPESPEFNVIGGELIPFEIECIDVDSELNYNWYLNSIFWGENASLVEYQTNNPGSFNMAVVVSDGTTSLETSWAVTVVEGPAWEIVIYPNSTVIYAEVTIDGEIAEAGDLVGAFIEEAEDREIECRGIGDIFVYEGHSYTTFNIQGSLIETVNFELYDLSADLIYTISYSTTTSPGGDLGYFPDNMIPLDASSNLPPVIDLPASVVILEDEPYQLDFSEFVSDLNGDEMLVNCLYNEHIDVQIEGMNVILQTELNWTEAEQLIFEVDDQMGMTRLVAIDSMMVYVIPQPDPPVIEIAAALETDEDIAIHLLLNESIYDPDGDEIVIEYIESEHLSIEITESELIIIPEENWFGEEGITISASDERSREIVSQDVMVTVVSVNDAPVIMLPDEYDMLEDEIGELNLSLYIYDIDNEVLELSSEPNENISVTIAGLEVTLVPDENYFGQELIYFEVDDNDSRAVSSDSILVNVGAVNDAPFIDLPESFELEEDGTGYLDISSYIGDVDNDSLNVDADDSDHIYITVDGYILGIEPESDWFGSETITVIISDDVSRLIATDEIAIIVSAVNDAPEINLPESFSFNEDEQLIEDFTDYLSDIEGDMLLLTAEMTTNLEITITDYEVTFNAAANWNGVELAIFNVYDNRGRLVDTDSVDVIVVSVNDAPQAAFLIDQTVIDGNSISFDGSDSYDLEGDELVYFWATTEDLLIDDPVAVSISIFAEDVSENYQSTLILTVYDGELLGESSCQITVLDDEPFNLHAEHTETDDVLFNWEQQEGFNATSYEVYLDSVFVGTTDELEYLLSMEEGMHLLGVKAINGEYASETMEINYEHTDIWEEEIPKYNGIDRIYPNPFSGIQRNMLTIEYSVDKKGKVEISVYNVLGQKVTDLCDEIKSPGNYEIHWNFKGYGNRDLGSGVYLILFRSESQEEIRKVNLIK